MKYTILILSLMTLTLAGCGRSMEAIEANAHLASLGEETQLNYQTLSTSVQAASAGVAPSKGLGDVSGLTDDQVVAKLEEQMRASLEQLKKRIAEGEANGTPAPKLLAENIDKLEAAIDKLFERLKTDAEFKKKFVDGIRNRPKPEDALKEAKKNPPANLPAQLCTRLAEELAAGKIPEALRERVKKDLETRCTK